MRLLKGLAGGLIIGIVLGFIVCFYLEYWVIHHGNSFIR